MELVLSTYNAHPYFSLKNLGTEMCVMHSKMQYFQFTVYETNWNVVGQGSSTPGPRTGTGPGLLGTGLHSRR